MAGTSGNLGKMTSSPRSKSQSRAQPYSGAKRRRSLRSIFATKKPIAIEVMEVSGNRVMTRSKLYRRLTTPNVPSITTRSAGLQKAANKNCKEVPYHQPNGGYFSRTPIEFLLLSTGPLLYIIPCMASNGSQLIKSPFPHEKAATISRDCSYLFC